MPSPLPAEVALMHPPLHAEVAPMHSPFRDEAALMPSRRTRAPPPRSWLVAARPRTPDLPSRLRYGRPRPKQSTSAGGRRRLKMGSRTSRASFVWDLGHGIMGAGARARQ